MKKKILIGVVTSYLHAFCLDRFIGSIENQTFRDFDVLFVDNSKSDYNEILEKKGFTVIKDAPKENRIENIISGRNIVRDYFLKGCYDYLFFLDSDVIAPENALKKLLSHKKPLVTGVYPTLKQGGGNQHVIPCLTYYISEDIVEQVPSEDCRSGKLIEIGVAGLGCCLIHRKILEKIAFRNIGDSKKAGEDAAFFYDARKKGFTAHADTSIDCTHLIRYTRESQGVEQTDRVPGYLKPMTDYEKEQIDKLNKEILSMKSKSKKG